MQINKQNKEEDGITKAFLIFHKFIVCQICQIQLPLNKDISSTIQQHLRQYEHQERIHTLCLKSLIIKESEPLFDLEQAQKYFQKQNKSEILKYFETELYRLFNDKELSKHTKQNYISTIKDYYYQLFIQRRNTVTENELKMEISNQKNKYNKSIFKQFSLQIKWKNIQDLQNGLQSQLQQEQKNLKIICQDWFQDNYMKNLITSLKESGYKRLSIALYLLYETNLNGDEIALLSFAQLKQGDHEVLNNSVNKRFNINEDQWQIIQSILQEDINKTQTTNLLYPNKARRDIQRELKDSKQILCFKQEDKNSNFSYFINKIKLKHIEENKKTIEKISQQVDKVNDINLSFANEKLKPQPQESQNYLVNEKGNQEHVQITNNNNQLSSKLFIEPIIGIKKIELIFLKNEGYRLINQC